MVEATIPTTEMYLKQALKSVSKREVAFCCTSSSSFIQSGAPSARDAVISVTSPSLGLPLAVCQVQRLLPQLLLPAVSFPFPGPALPGSRWPGLAFDAD